MDELKKGLFLVLALALLAGRAGAAEKRIGVLMFSEEGRYKEAVRGMRDRLAEAGFKEPRVVFIIDHAAASKAKAAELVRKYSAEKLDLIFTLGTSITVPLAREIRDTPLVFSIVYDPVEAGIAKTWKSSGNNTTGTSTFLPMSLVMKRLLEFAPVKRLAVLYTPGEKNSESQLKDLQNEQAASFVKVVPVPLAVKEDIDDLLPEVVRTSDALYITGSNLVNSRLEFIVDMATRARVATVTHLDDLVERGVLLGVCPDAYKLGRLAGEKVLRIFRGEKPSSLPIEAPGEHELIINSKTARAGGFQVPPAFLKNVKKEIR